MNISTKSCVKHCSLFGWAALVGGLLLGGRPARAINLLEISTVSVPGSDPVLLSAAIDSTGGYLYLASSRTAVDGRSVHRIRLSDVTAQGGVDGGPERLTVALVDASEGYGYFASSASPAQLIKVRLSDLVIVSTITFGSGIDYIGAGVIDPLNRRILLGTRTSPGIVVKVDLENFVQVDSVSLPSGVDQVATAVLGAGNDYAYFGSSTTTGIVTRIQLDTMAATRLNVTGVGGLIASAVDTTTRLLYFGSSDNPGKIVKIDPSAFSVVDTLALESGFSGVGALAVDSTRRRAYAGTRTTPPQIVEVNLSSLIRVSSLELPQGSTVAAVAWDASGRYAYFGMQASSAAVSKIDVIAGAPEIQTPPSDQTVAVGASAAFSIEAVGRSLSYQWQRDGGDVAGATGASYTFSGASLVDNGARFRCVVTNSSGTAVSAEAELRVRPDVHVYPNPWRVDRHPIGIHFSGLRPGWTVKIFTLAAQWVKSLSVDEAEETWDLKTDDGDSVASGYYFYVVDTGDSETRAKGKIAVIR